MAGAFGEDHEIHAGNAIRHEEESLGGIKMPRQRWREHGDYILKVEGRSECLGPGAALGFMVFTTTPDETRRTGESRCPAPSSHWIPAHAGMTLAGYRVFSS
jgi:hypothetical protein